MTDVLIAGGGLARSGLAIQLGRLGLSVELFERSCGRTLFHFVWSRVSCLCKDAAFDGLSLFIDHAQRLVRRRIPQLDFDFSELSVMRLVGPRVNDRLFVAQCLLDRLIDAG